MLLPVVLLDQFATAVLKSLERAYLVLAHEAAVANHVGIAESRRSIRAVRLP